MNLVLDSNIFISGLITPNGTISKLILRDLKGTLICFKLWTGDKKLSEGLKRKGLNLTIDTRQLLRQIEI
jgi:predicted nucleic acid-binding protein